jgi:cysteine desulfurase
MAANNETGVLQPITEIRDLAKSAGAHLHVDATQIAGKLPFDFNALGIDLASVSAHKLHGPKGVGALLLRKGLEWPALLPGSQERGRRGGTENLPGIVGFGAAAKLAAARMLADVPTIQALRGALEQQLLDALPVRIFGGGAARLPNTTYLRIGTLDADLVLNRLERADVVAASGSACAAGGHEPSHVLLAMGVDADEARCALRLSLGRESTVADIEATVACLRQVYECQLAVAA